MTTLRAKSIVATVAERQFGRISRAQLQENGVAPATVAGWIEHGYLHRELPHVYAVGSRARTTESDLAAALLYAGPGAALSHATAAWWLGLLEEKPRRIQVTTPRRCRSLTSVRVYDRRRRGRILHRRLALTSVPEILFDVAATAPLRDLRRALAGADYRGLLDLQEIDRLLRSGARGSRKLRQAVRQHRPDLARTKSRLERKLFEICETEHLPLPQINATLAGWEVDALWARHNLVVELDGYGNHHTPAQLRRDRRKEMALRRAGQTVLRYSEEQLDDSRQVAAELREATAVQTPVLWSSR